MKRALALIAGAALLALGVWSAVALGAGNDQRETSTVATTTATTTTGETGTTTGETTDTTTGETDTTTGETDTTTGETDTTTGETDTTTGGPDTSTGETTDTTTGKSPDTTAAASKVWVCHHTGSWKHPYHLIHISTHALHAHLRTGGVLPGANKSCPTTRPAEGKTHGQGRGHGARPSGHGNDQSEATETNDD